MRETRPSETVVRSSTRPTVFICYAHADNESQDRKLLWLDRFRTFLAPCVRQDHVTVWSDREIQAGENWHETIQARLAAADAAVLLVSPYLLASEYFANSELPVLLKGASDRGLRIISILLAPCGFDRAKFKYPDPRTGPNEFTLSSLQAANAPSETLLDLSEAEQNRVFTRVAGQLADLVPQTDGNRVRQPIS